MVKKNKTFIIKCMIAAAIVCAAVLTLAALLSFQHPAADSSDLRRIEFKGQYSFDGKVWQEYDSDENVSAFDHQSVMLKGRFSEAISCQKPLVFLVNFLEVHIASGGETLFSFGEKGSFPNIMQSGGKGYVRARLSKDISESDFVEITLESKYKNNFYTAYNDFLNNVFAGDSGLLLKSLLKEDNLFCLSGIFLLFLGLALLIAAVVLIVKKVPFNKSAVYFSLCVVSASLYIFINGSYISLIFSQRHLLMFIETLLLFFELSLMLLFFRSLFQSKITKLLAGISVNVNTALLFVFLLLQLTGTADAYEFRSYYVPIVAILVIFSAALVIYETVKAKGFKNRYVFCTMLVPVVFVLFESLNYAIELFDPNFVTVCGLLLFLILQLPQAFKVLTDAVMSARRAAEIEKELSENRLSLLLSQIQPHFVFNTLNTIRYLCKTDSAGAAGAIEKFSKYLRTNLNAAELKNPIPFSAELNHVENYLSIELMRFQNLKVVYEIESTDFSVPALSLQPLVSNAVQHGIGKKDGGGTVTVSAYEDEKNYFMKVCDDGAGFDTADVLSDGNAHIGLTNCRERVEILCGGSLQVQSEKGKGTSVTVAIPKTPKEPFNSADS